MSPPEPEAEERSGLTTRGGTRCPVCRATARAAMDLRDFQLYACATCGSWSSDALARRATTGFDPDAYFANAGEDRRRWDDLLRRAGIDAGRAARILDVGCGRGDFLAHLAAQHPATERFGIELDPERAADARRLDPGAHVEAGDAEAALGALPGGFDLVTLWDVFEHLPDPTGVLRALAARLAPSGAIFLQTIHEQSLVPALGRAIYVASGGRIVGPARRTHEAHHLVFFSRRGLETAAAGASLRIRSLWFDRLARARMDGPRALTAATAALLALENALGNGLFVNLILERAGD